MPTIDLTSDQVIELMPLLSGYKSNNFNWLRSVSCSDASISA